MRQPSRKKTRAVNPFYFLLVVVGLAFLATACTYGVMSYQAIAPVTASAGGADQAELLRWIDKHGFALMMWQVAALGLLSVAAIATDGFWERRAAGRTAGTHGMPD